MTGRQVLVPGPDHPITISPADSRVTIRFNGRVIARTDDALMLRESTYPPVFYLPLDAVDADVLQPTRHRTYCPFKGVASYYSLVYDSLGEEGRVAKNAVWCYVAPYDAVSDIAGRVAFYPQHVEIVVGEHAGSASAIGRDVSG
jgi:uncharacterized protein (DUF427 family)